MGVRSGGRGVGVGMTVLLVTGLPVGFLAGDAAVADGAATRADLEGDGAGDAFLPRGHRALCAGALASFHGAFEHGDHASVALLLGQRKGSAARPIASTQVDPVVQEPLRHVVDRVISGHAQCGALRGAREVEVRACSGHGVHERHCPSEGNVVDKSVAVAI